MLCPPSPDNQFDDRQTWRTLDQVRYSSNLPHGGRIRWPTFQRLSSPKPTAQSAPTRSALPTRCYSCSAASRSGVSGLPAPLYGIYETVWHLSPLSTTIVFAVYAVAALGAVLVSGRISDVVGRKPVLLAAIVAMIVGLGVFLVADNMALLLVARAIHGAAVGSIVVAAAAALLDLRPQHGLRSGQLSGVSFNIGMTVAIVGSSVLAQYAPHPLRTPYAVVAVVCADRRRRRAGAARTAHGTLPRPHPDLQARGARGDPRGLLVLRTRRDGVLVGAGRAAVAVPVAGRPSDPHRQPDVRRRRRRCHRVRGRAGSAGRHPGARPAGGHHR